MDRVTAANGVVFFRSPLLASVGVRHAFSSRIGGVSSGPYASLNLGNPSGIPNPDPDINLAENYRRLSSAASLPETRCWAFQVHGPDCLTVRANTPFENGQKADALLSCDPARALSIRAADCAAVLIASTDGRTVAAIHAGWRGVIANVISTAVTAMRSAGATPHAAAIFPCISYDHFEVGHEVVAAFREQHLPAREVSPTKGRADVPGSCELQLRQAGISLIDNANLCTYADPTHFFSHRRDAGITGRMALLASPTL